MRVIPPGLIDRDGPPSLDCYLVIPTGAATSLDDPAASS